MRIFASRLRDVQVRLRAPLRRAARNVPIPSRQPVLMPTVPLSAVPELPDEAPPASTERAALLPALPQLAEAPASFVPPTVRSIESTPLELPRADARSTGTPVEVTARPSRAPSRGATGALLGLIAAALALSAWLLLGPAPPPAPKVAAPGPTASASAAAPSASASARPAPPRRPAPARGTLVRSP